MGNHPLSPFIDLPRPLSPPPQPQPRSPLAHNDALDRASEGISTLARFYTRRILLSVFVFLCCLLYFLLQRQPSPLVNDIGKFKSRFQLTPSTRNATMSAGISAIRIPAKANATAAIIWLHGLGDSGSGWSFISQYYNMSVIPFLCRLLIVACQGMGVAREGR